MLAFLLMHSYGLLGLALSTPIAQLLTNHWFMIWRGLRRLRLSILGYISQVLLPVLAGFFVLFWLLVAVRSAMYGANLYLMVTSAIAIGGVVCITGIMFFVLNAAERTRLVAMILRQRAS